MTKKKKRGRGRPPLPKHLKKAKGKKKAKAKAPAKRPKKKAAAPRASTRKKVPLDLVAGKFCIYAEGHGLMLKEAATTDVPHFRIPAPDVPYNAFALFESREDARLVVERFHPRQETAAADVDLGFEDEAADLGAAPLAAAQPLDGMEPSNQPAAQALNESTTAAVFEPVAAAEAPYVPPLEVVPLKNYYATSYEIELSNELVRTVKWKSEATSLAAAVRAVRTDLAEHVKKHEKELKEFDRKVANARKDNLHDVKTAKTALDKFNKVVASYA